MKKLVLILLLCSTQMFAAYDSDSKFEATGKVALSGYGFLCGGLCCAGLWAGKSLAESVAMGGMGCSLCVGSALNLCCLKNPKAFEGGTYGEACHLVNAGCGVASYGASAALALVAKPKTCIYMAGTCGAAGIGLFGAAMVVAGTVDLIKKIRSDCSMSRK